MKFDIKRQSEYSRGELLLRTFFGFFYILIPHGFALLFLGIGSAVVTFVSFWMLLITGQVSEGMHNFQVNLLRWNARVSARFYNLRDGYPAFGLSAVDEGITLEVPYLQTRDRLSAVLRYFFGFIYVMIPHAFCLYFLSIGAAIVNQIQFFIILFTGQANEGMFNYVVGVMRWSTRVNVFMNYLSDTYPAFSLGETPEEAAANANSKNVHADPFGVNR